MSIPIEWQTVVRNGSENTERLPVPGGWLYRTIILPRSSDSQPAVVSMVFVPDGFRAAATLDALSRSPR